VGKGDGYSTVPSATISSVDSRRFMALSKSVGFQGDQTRLEFKSMIRSKKALSPLEMHWCAREVLFSSVMKGGRDLRVPKYLDRGKWVEWVECLWGMSFVIKLCD
jgi:hypothetical protein